jgi:hypothetical protein
MRPASSRTFLVLAVALVVACGTSTRSTRSVSDPRVGKVFYLCCNVHFDAAKPTITDALSTQGTLIPFGTRVEVRKVTRDTVTFEAVGHPPITLEYTYGAKALSFDQYLGRLFVTEDPRLKLKKVPARQVKLVEKGTVAPGMSRDQVIMALGYPTADRTPSLEASSWTYSTGSSQALVVYFDGGRVSSVQQQAAGRSRRK